MTSQSSARPGRLPSGHSRGATRRKGRHHRKGKARLTCLNWGCIPTKALIAAAETFEKIKHAEKLGITVKDASVDYSVMIGNKDKAVGTLRSGINSLLTADV